MDSFEVTCSHCGKQVQVELAGPSDLKEVYGYGPNKILRLQRLGVFPIPVLKFANRSEYLKSDMDAFAETERRERAMQRASDLEQDLHDLSEDERQQIIEILAARTKKKIKN